MDEEDFEAVAVAIAIATEDDPRRKLIIIDNIWGVHTQLNIIDNIIDNMIVQA